MNDDAQVLHSNRPFFDSNFCISYYSATVAMAKATYRKEDSIGLMDSERWSIMAWRHGNKQQAWWPQKEIKDHIFNLQASSREGKLEIGQGFEISKPTCNDVLPPGGISL